MVRLCLPVKEWPVLDQEAWRAAHRHSGLLDDDGLAADWAPATSEINASAYGRFLSFLAEIGELDPATPPVARITRPRVEAYIEHLRQRNHSSTVAGRIRQLVEAARVMAPDQNWRWLRNIRARLRHLSSPARDDRARLVPAATVKDLNLQLVERADRATGLSDRHRALLFRDALMLAVLGVCPLRAKNMAGMTIGRTLQRRGTEWWINFPAAEMKNQRPFEAPLPAAFAPLIERYIEYYRPILTGRASIPVAGDALWISDQGIPLTAKAVGQIVSRRTAHELGRALNPHLFRKLVPTELAIHDPQHVGVAQALLGHADYQTTQQAYNLGRALDAARRHQAMLHAIGADAVGPAKPKGKS